jgi:transposase InsO family protein
LQTGKRTERPEDRRCSESRTPERTTSDEWKQWLDTISNFGENFSLRTRCDDLRPYVEVKILDQRFKALIDTGSMITLIGPRITAYLRRRGIEAIAVNVQINMANGVSTKIKEAYRFPCTVNEKECTVKALSLSQLTTEMILGMDALPALQICDFLHPKICGNFAFENKIPTRNDCEIAAISELTDSENKVLQRFLEEELPKFDQVKGRTNLVTHQIRLKPGTVPIKQRYYPRNPAMQKILDDEIDKMLADGVVERSNSPWSSPIVMVKKPSGKYRCCIDLRKVNEASIRDAYPLPQVNAILEKLREAHYISTLDLKNGYWQVGLEEESRPITAFTVAGRGLFQFRVMPFGLHSAPATFQRLLDMVIGPEFEPHAFAYLDDIVLVSKTFKEHLELLRKVFGRLREAGLILNPEKCHFCKTELKYLGHVINRNGIQTDPEKVKAIEEFPTPKNVRGVRSFLGLASWYRRFVPGFATLTAPLTKLLRKDTKFIWSETTEKAFKILKEKLSSTPVLACPDFNVKFVLQVDASNEGLGATLTQQVDNQEKVIAYASRLLSQAEQKYTVTERECLSLVWAVRKFRPYLEGYSFTAITDHRALKWLMTLEKPSGRLARWILELQQHDFDIQYRKGTLNCVADALSRFPILTDEENREGGSIEVKMYDNSNVTSDTVIPVEDANSSVKTKTSWWQRKFDQVKTSPNKNPDFVIKNDKLYRIVQPKKGRPADPTTICKMCVPEELKDQVLRENHDSPTAGHLGVNKAIKRVADRYFWPGWRKQVREYVRNCESCQKAKPEQKLPRGKMHFREPQGPWHVVTTDIIGPLPRSKKGNKYILVMQDNFTKWVELAAMKSATAQAVVQPFTDMILLRYGAPEKVITDNGTQYTSKIFNKLTETWGVKHQCTAPYSPQGNPTERANKVVKTMISQFVNNDHRNWDVYLNEFRFALNSAVHDSTKFSPALLNFGRELKPPKATVEELVSAEQQEQALSFEDLQDQRMARIKWLQGQCKENLSKAYQRQAKHYNLRRRENDFVVGEKVLRRSHVLSSAADYVASKLAYKFDGPFIIHRPLGLNLFELKDEKGKSVGAAHVKDLKKFIPQTVA